MARGGVTFDVTGTDVHSTLRAVLDSISLPVPFDKEELLERLLAREALASTGIGGGIAIPHPRKPLENIPDGGVIATCFLKSPADYCAVDQKPVFVLFLMLSPTTKRHLELLSRLSYCLGNPSISGILPNVRERKTLLLAISRVEKELQSSGA
jgi:PTS system nitrogen regulatory IIA component